jgi:AraC-like DNA-binding protein
MNSHHNSSPRERIVENLRSTDFFNSYQSAFILLTTLPLTLEASGATEELLKAETRMSNAGVADSRVPVRVGKTLIAVLRTGGVRFAPATANAFEPVAKQMLDDGSSASEIRTARDAFMKLPVMHADRYESSLALLKSFAFQLGESAHRLLFSTSQHEPEPVRLAKTYIMQHLAEPMSLEHVASQVNVSPFHFCKVFKRATGMTFTDFVNHARVEKARRMLMKPEARITEVAYDVGFQSLSHFNRSFRRIASESPTEFRSRLKSGSGVPLVAA